MQAINKLILGTVQFGLEYGINNTIGKPNQNSINKILSLAYNSGIRILDTAEAYGNAHEVIGNFHRDHPQTVFEVITKLPSDINESIEPKIQTYLNQLNIKQLHALLFHSFDSYANNAESLNLLQRYKNDGTLKYLGVSVYTNSEMEAVIEDDRVDIIQLPFNLLDNVSVRGQLIEKAKSKGKKVHTRSAFLQGLFFLPLSSEKKIAGELKNELGYIHQLSEQYEMPLQKMALNYCLQQDSIDNVLIGVDSEQQLLQNVSYADYSLNGELMTAIDDINVKNVDLLNPSLWKQ